MRKELKDSIVEVIVENLILDKLNEIEFSVSFDDIVNREELNEDYLGKNVWLGFRYSICDDKLLDVYVEKERIIYIVLDNEENEIDEFVLDDLECSIY